MHSGLVKKPGRPVTVKKQDVLDLLERHTSDIFHPDSQNLISKTDPIWTTFVREFQNRVLPATIYTYACGFKKGLKSNKNEKDELDNSDLSVHDKTTSIFNNSSLSLDKDIHLQLPLDKNEFMAMTEFYKKTCLSRKKGYRMAVRFIPGTYTDKIFDEIVRMTKLCCAFRIDTTHIPLSYDSGYIKAECRCGSFLHIDINFDKDPDRVCYDCSITLGILKDCGKLWLSNRQRREAAEKLQNKPVEKYRAELAKQLFKSGDPEPPNFPSAAVLRQAKYQLAKEKYIHEDPIKALDTMSCSKYQSEIQFFCVKPFFTIYWLGPQLQLYRKYCNKKGSVVSIDASGGFAKPLKKMYGRPSRPILLYETKISCAAGKFSTAQMLSESHDTDKIVFFLNTQTRQAGCVPSEVVTDMSRALMNAVTQAYTRFHSIEEYADCLFEKSGTLPGTYLRLDNAHFIHLYSTFFAKKPRRLRKFFLGAIGQLMICRNKSDAKVIVKCILTLAFSKNYGSMLNGFKSPAQKSKEKLEALMTRDEELDEIMKKVEDVENDPETENNFSLKFQAQLEKLEESVKVTENKWSAWGKAIKAEVDSDLTQQIGSDISPYHLPDLGKYLMKHLALLPIWSAICKDDFKSEKLLGISSANETGFKVLKTDVFPDLPYRVDYLVDQSLECLEGKMNIIEAGQSRICEEKSTDSESSADENDEPDPKSNAVDECPACKDHLPFPRTCVQCAAGIHHLLGCSYPQNVDDERYGEARICRNCHRKVEKLTDPAPPLRKKVIDFQDNTLEGCSVKSVQRVKKMNSRVKSSKRKLTDFSADDVHETQTRIAKRIKSDVLPKVLSPPLIVSNDYNGDSDDEIPIESHRTVQATRETENWRGLEEKSVSKALYYGDRKELLRDAISSKRYHQIDVLKNGNLSSSKLINIKGQSVTVANTCAFDSIAQLLYVAICDNEALREKITTCHDEFPKFLSNLQKNGIISDTYTRRAEVLLEGRELKNIDNYPAISGLQAASNVVDLASKLTKEFSTIQEIWECSENSCPVIYETRTRTRTIRLIRLMDNQIADCNLLEANQNSNLCQGRQRETCSGERKNVISGIGHILLVEVINEDPTKMSKPISVKQLPKSVPSPINDGTKLTLLGAIAYHGPSRITPGRRKRIAHYTAVCLRNHTWYEYDDVYPQRKKSLPDGAKIVPELLIFSKL